MFWSPIAVSSKIKALSLKLNQQISEKRNFAECHFINHSLIINHNNVCALSNLPNGSFLPLLRLTSCESSIDLHSRETLQNQTIRKRNVTEKKWWRTRSIEELSERSIHWREISAKAINRSPRLAIWNYYSVALRKLNEERNEIKNKKIHELTLQ